MCGESATIRPGSLWPRCRPSGQSGEAEVLWGRSLLHFLKYEKEIVKYLDTASHFLPTNKQHRAGDIHHTARAAEQLIT
jgi:hypothetical protein